MNNQSKSNQSFNYQYSSRSSSKFIPFINDVLGYQYIKSTESADFIPISAEKSIDEHIEFSTYLPPIFKHNNCIKISTKVEYILKRHTPKKLLKAIHPNIDVSIEMCLLFTTCLNSTYFESKVSIRPEKWKSLKSEYLRSFFSTSPLTYKYIIKALEAPLKNGQIVECDHVSAKGRKCYNYRFGESYFGKGIINYELKTEEAINLLNKHYKRLYNNAIQNPICRNLIKFYSKILLPTILEQEQEGKILIKTKSKSKKGKKYAFLNKHSRNRFKNHKQISFIEDSIKVFKYLTENGLLIPRPGSENSGGRVVDSISCMPSWIRKLIKVDGKSLVEVDYSCLHPNIAIMLYGGKQEYITHEKIAKLSGLDKIKVKKQHLSMFNAEVSDMFHYDIYKYYKEAEPAMMNRIIAEKHESEYEHKVTSRKMFKKEVEVMSEVIETLNKEDIYVGYGYDALYCEPDHAYRVKKVMDAVVLKHRIKTVAKISNVTEQNWRPIKDYENIYEINELSEIRSLNKRNYHHILKQRIDRAGYKTVRLSLKGKTATEYVHRLIGNTYLDNPNNRCCINHIDGDKLNNNLGNLEWSSHSENMKHAYQSGLVTNLKSRYKPVIDKCSGEIFESIKKAADYYMIPYTTCKNYINGNRNNPTCLSYLNTNVV